MKKNAAIYCRVSTEEQAREGFFRRTIRDYVSSEIIMFIEFMKMLE